MSVQYIENEIVHLNGELVTVVRQFTQTQSDSWNGQLSVIKVGENRYKYLITAMDGKSTLFSMCDVLRVEPSLSVSVGTSQIIRLKGSM